VRSKFRDPQPTTSDDEREDGKTGIRQSRIIKKESAVKKEKEEHHFFRVWGFSQKQTEIIAKELVD